MGVNIFWRRTFVLKTINDVIFVLFMASVQSFQLSCAESSDMK